MCNCDLSQNSITCVCIYKTPYYFAIFIFILWKSAISFIISNYKCLNGFWLMYFWCAIWMLSQSYLHGLICVRIHQVRVSQRCIMKFTNEFLGENIPKHKCPSKITFLIRIVMFEYFWFSFLTFIKNPNFQTYFLFQRCRRVFEIILYSGEMLFYSNRPKNVSKL